MSRESSQVQAAKAIEEALTSAEGMSRLPILIGWYISILRCADGLRIRVYGPDKMSWGLLYEGRDKQMAIVATAAGFELAKYMAPCIRIESLVEFE